MEDLPKVYEGKVNNNINNTQSIFYGNELLIRNDKRVNIDKKINNIFKDGRHVYKSVVKIYYPDKSEIKTIVGKKNNSLITIKGELISINNIIDIERI